MSFGILFTHNPSPRTTTVLALAKAKNLDLEIIYAEKKNKDGYEQLCRYNPLGTIPTFVGNDGLILTECIPLTLYFASQPSPESTSESDPHHLLGQTKTDYYNILKWMSFANSDLFPAVGGVFLPLIGQRQIIRQDGKDSLHAMLLRCQYVDDHLRENEYLVGGSLTLADVFVVSMLHGTFVAFRREMESRFPALSRWYNDVGEVGWYKAVAGEVPNLDFELPIYE